MHQVRPALAAVLAVSAVLVFGGPDRAVRAQAGTPAVPRPADGGQVPLPDDPDSGVPVAIDPLTGRPVPIDPLTGKPVTDTKDATAAGSTRQRLSTARVFASESGLILTPVKVAMVKDFEMVVARIHEALAKSADPARVQQAAGWKVYRAAEPGPGGSVLFVFLMSPTVKGADYTMGKILLEAFPQDEVQDIFDTYTLALAGPQSLLSLRLIDDFSQPARPRLPERK